MVGLGNPGEKYQATRHNAGQWVIADLVRRYDAKLRRSRRDHSKITEVTIDAQRVVLAVPGVFMNESGRSVGPLVHRHLGTAGGARDTGEPGGRADLQRLVVVHDELDLPVGRLKIKVGGGIAGHNGLESIRAHLRSSDFTRLRLGIGKPQSTPRGGSYVLKRPGRAESAELDAMVQRAADAVVSIAVDGIERAMNRFNAVGT